MKFNLISMRVNLTNWELNYHVPKLLTATYLRETFLRKLKKYLNISIVWSAIRQESNNVALFFSSAPNC